MHEAEGLEPPETAFQPDAFPEAEFYLGAFSALSGERQIGAMGGAGPIPWSAVLRYARFWGIADRDEADRLWRMIRAMDGAYLDHLAAKQKADMEQAKAGSKGKR